MSYLSDLWLSADGKGRRVNISRGFSHSQHLDFRRNSLHIRSMQRNWEILFVKCVTCPAGGSILHYKSIYSLSEFCAWLGSILRKGLTWKKSPPFAEYAKDEEFQIWCSAICPPLLFIESNFWCRKNAKIPGRLWPKAIIEERCNHMKMFSSIYDFVVYIF